MSLSKESSGACGKWSIGVGENWEIKIKYGEYPNYGTLDLHDASQEEFYRIGKMFLDLADHISKIEDDCRVVQYNEEQTKHLYKRLKGEF